MASRGALQLLASTTTHLALLAPPDQPPYQNTSQCRHFLLGTQVCELPSMVAYSLFKRLTGCEAGEEEGAAVPRDTFIKFWTGRGLVTAPPPKRAFDSLRPDGQDVSLGATYGARDVSTAAGHRLWLSLERRLGTRAGLLHWHPMWRTAASWCDSTTNRCTWSRLLSPSAYAAHFLYSLHTQPRMRPPLASSKHACPLST